MNIALNGTFRALLVTTSGDQGVWPDVDPTPATCRVKRNNVATTQQITIARDADITGGFNVVFDPAAAAAGDVWRIEVPYQVDGADGVAVAEFGIASDLSPVLTALANVPTAEQNANATASKLDETGVKIMQAQRQVS